MTEAVRTDPETGLKVFNTRAAAAVADVTGSGYAAVNNGALFFRSLWGVGWAGTYMPGLKALSDLIESPQ